MVRPTTWSVPKRLIASLCEMIAGLRSRRAGAGQHRQIDDLQEVVVGEQIILGRRRLPVLDEDRRAD